MLAAQPIKKKLKRYEPHGDPLPVPIASITGVPSSAASWNYYEGIYQSGIVRVTAFDDISSLWHNGYFGQLKNSDAQSEACKNKKGHKHQKRWKLLESDGLKDASFFKKLDEVDRDSEVVEAITIAESGMRESSEGSQFQSKEKAASNEFDTDSTKNSKEQNDTVFKTNKNENSLNLKTESKKDLAMSSEHNDKRNSSSKLECRTVLSFESDQNAAQIFDSDNQVNGHVYLELSLEEAMFLSYALGCLVVTQTGHGGKRKNLMKIDQMWKEFVNKDPKFVARYAVYHHYRTKGWVVKSGLKFGADYVLYPVGPPFYHAQYTVMIQSVWADNHERDSSLCSREMSWTNLAATERLNSHVKKTPLICYVLRPRGLTADRFRNIICLRSLGIEEVVLSRWDPNAVNNEPGDIITLE